MGRLSTHVLDTARGLPAEGVSVELFWLDASGEARLIVQARTSGDGRTAEPLIADGDLRPGNYELVFAIGDYFRSAGVLKAGPAFLERIPIRFQICASDENYHIPLVCTPWSYATYRGS
jgi:5-hydroxyisourate hydrolase